MRFDEFTKFSLSAWREYFSHVSNMATKNCLRSWGGAPLYPNIMFVTNCDDFFVVELFGASPVYAGLTLKKGKSQDIYKYLNQFDCEVVEPVAVLNGKGVISNMSYSHKADFDKVAERFPVFSEEMSGYVRYGGEGSLFSFADTFESVYFNNCLLVNQKNSLYRVKSILSLSIVRRDASKADIASFYSSIFERKEVVGIHTAEGNDEVLKLAGQFQNVYLSNGLHETTIGEFLKLHPRFVEKALSCESFLYEKSFKWIKSFDVIEETSINPDLLIRRADGFYDIYDLKTAAFNKKSLTKGSRSRRRFIDYVYEGVAQLINYRAYFDVPENAIYAREMHGVLISKPRLVLIVGSWENATREELDQVSKVHCDVEIIDYDTFCQMFIEASLRSGDQERVA